MGLNSAVDWRDGLDAGDLSSESLVRLALDRIASADGPLHALLSVDREGALRLARAADARLRRGERTPVLGLPIILKDNLHWEGRPVSCASRIQEGYQAPYQATVVERLLAAGAIPVAKANLDEFAMGSSGEYSAYGSARNPWDPTRVPGGSSSGSAVAVSAGYVPLALGSDTGGSVRLPAGFCNLTALRPTYGVLSRHGLTAMASSLDQVGPLGASAADVALAMEVMVGRDPLDSTSADLPGAGRLAGLRPAGLTGLRIGLPEEALGEGLEPGMRSLILEAAETFRRSGATLQDVALPHTRYAIDTYYLLSTSEAASNLSRFDGLRFGARADSGSLAGTIAATRDRGFGAEVKRRILLGTFCLSRDAYEALYVKAQKVRTLVARDFQQAFAQVDVLLMPVSPGPAFPMGALTGDPLAMHLADALTVSAPLAGLPCLSMPAGFTQGLPGGIQLVGPAFSDVLLLEIAHAFQSITRHHLETPPQTAIGATHGL